MNASKPHVLLALLQRCRTAFVHLDPRRPGVTCPHRFRAQAQLVLQLGYDMPQPQRDLIVSENGFTVGLMFKGTLEFLVVPWTSVFALVGDDAKGAVWGPDVPPEISAKLQAEALKKAPAAQKVQPADVVDARERFEGARIDGAIARNFDGPPPAEAPLAEVISLAGRKPRAKA